MKHFNGHALKTGDVVSVRSRNEFTKDMIVSHVCSRFIHVGGKLFWKTSGTGANAEAIGYKLEKIK